MKQRLLFLILILVVGFKGVSQEGPPPPCGLEVSYICDIVQDGIEVINLHEHMTFIFCTVNQPSQDDYYPYVFYLTQADYDNNTNPIVNPESYVLSVPQQTIWAKAQPIDPINDPILGKYSSFVLINPAVINMPSPLYVCDSNSDGFAIFNLTSKNDEIFPSQGGYLLRYFETEQDAQNGVNEIPYTEYSSYHNTVPFQQTIYVGVYVDSANSPGCIQIAPLDLFAVGLTQCGNADFTMTPTCDGATATITGNTGGTFAIFNPSDSAVIDPSTGTIIGGTPGETYFVIYTAPLPDTVSSGVSVTVYPLEDPSFVMTPNCFGGSATITGDLGGTFTFLPDLGDGAIINPTTGAITDGIPGQTYTVKYETSGPCPESSLENITIPNSPIVNQPSPLIMCEDYPGNYSIFDLTFSVNEITGGDPNTNVSYYETLADAQSGTNPISNVSSYSNLTNPQSLYVKAANSNYSCDDIAVLTLQVFRYVEFSSPSIAECDDDIDGFTTFDLTSIEPQILENYPNLEFTYFETQQDVDTGTNAILTPEAYTNIYNPQLLYIGTLNTESGCYSVNHLELFVTDCLDTDSDGVADADEDINGNGNLDDDDTDGDTIPNYLDMDDDGDNVDTSIEIDSGSILNSLSATYSFIDTDNDLIENYLDDDDDGDGVLTIDEDYNQNGDPTDDDTNTNGVPDYLDNTVVLSVSEWTTLSVKIYPNPATVSVTIDTGMNSMGNLQVQLIDIQGKMLLSRSLEQKTLDISQLVSGIYFLRVKGEGLQGKVFKLVKK
ncbi:MAG: T9SS type A sorting domain-containing protein [Flavobacteriaceae bacterium]|nr:T9SS type A sorting domain-containing protein [Flavobacteriaceae bacterium]